MAVMLIVNNSECQNSFIFKYATLFDETPFDAIETADSGYIITARTGTYSSNNYNALIIKLNRIGDTVKTKFFTKSSGTCLLTDIFRSNDGNYFISGTQQFSMETKLWLLKINSDLEVLLDTTFSIGQPVVFNFFGFIDSHNDIILYGTAGINLVEICPYVYKLTQTGDSISYKYFQDIHYPIVQSMIEKPDTSGYYMMIIGEYQINTNTPGQILSLDVNLEIKKINGLPYSLDLYYCSKAVDRNRFILTGKKHIPFSNPRTDKLGILKLDSTFSILDSNLVGPDDTINYPGYFHNLDFVDTNKIFYGGTVNQDLNTFSTSKSFLFLGKFEHNQILTLQKRYGGDKYYSLWGIRASQDGSCLLLASTFDYLSQNMERDILIIKVDSNGVITSSNDKAHVKSQNFTLYPNPGNDYLIIESSCQVLGATITIFDIYGKQIIQNTSVQLNFNR